MATKITRAIADFALETKFEDLPKSIVEETKKVLMEHIGVGLAALTTDKGKLAVALGRRLGGPPESSILGTGDRVSPSTAALVNADLMITLDYCDNISFGHDGLFVIPPAMAIAESAGASGKDLILATALGLEISSRLARAARWHTITSEEVQQAVGHPPKNKNAHSTFGGAAAAGRLLKLDPERMLHALGIAGRHIVMSLSSGKGEASMRSMTKYIVPGWQNTGAVISALLAQMGYLGDITVLDAPERLDWEPGYIAADIGKNWIFSHQLHYKPYPCCGSFHNNLDCFYNIIEENGLRPEEIEQVEIYGSWPIQTPRNADDEIDGIYAAQFNQPYNFSLLAHRVKRGVEWADPDTMKNPAILGFMNKVSFHSDADFTKKAASARIEDPRVRPARVEVTARGQVFASEIKFRRGDTFSELGWTWGDAVEKFRHNVERILTRDKGEQAIESLLNLEQIDQVSQLIRHITL